MGKKELMRSFIEAETHTMFWVGRDLRDNFIPNLAAMGRTQFPLQILAGSRGEGRKMLFCKPDKCVTVPERGIGQGRVLTHHG